MSSASQHWAASLFHVSRHFHASREIFGEVLPLDRSPQNFSEQLLQVIGSLPREPLAQLLQQKLLNLGRLNVAQALVAEARQQVLFK